MTSLHAFNILIHGCWTELDQCSRVLKKTACSAVCRKTTQHNFDCNRSRVRSAVLKSALLLSTLRRRPYRLTYAGPEQPQGVERVVTGWEKNLDFISFSTEGPRRGVCWSGIWNHCNVAEGSSWTKNFRLNVLSSENHFRSASCLCCLFQHSSANVCPSSEDMEPSPSPVF